MKYLSKLKWQGEDLRIRDGNSYPRKVKALFIGDETAFLAWSASAGEIDSDGFFDDGAGFNVMGLGGRNFIALLNEAEPDEAVTDIVIIGCSSCVPGSTLGSAMSDFAERAAELFPGARLTLSMADWIVSDQARARVLKSDLEAYALLYGYDYAPLDYFAQYSDYTDAYGRIDYAGDYARALVKYLVYGKHAHHGPVMSRDVDADDATPIRVTSYVDADQGVAHMQIDSTIEIAHIESATMNGTNEITVRSTDYADTSGTWYATLAGDARVLIKTASNELVLVDAKIRLENGRLFLSDMYVPNGTTYRTLNISSYKIIESTLTGLIYE